MATDETRPPVAAKQLLAGHLVAPLPDSTAAGAAHAMCCLPGPSRLLGGQRPRRRVLPLPQFVVTALARHIELFGLGPEQTVFFLPRGGLWRRGSFNETVWKPALERAGLPREYGFHALRHTYASSLISAGLHPRVIQARLGHKSIVETMDTYGHLFPDANEETTRALDAHYSAALLRRSHGA